MAVLTLPESGAAGVAVAPSRRVPAWAWAVWLALESIGCARAATELDRRARFLEVSDPVRAALLRDAARSCRTGR